MAAEKVTSRQRILAAAAQVSRDVGPAHLSLDAVAQRAAVSKGGLLYHFPSKAKLLEALVEQHLSEFDAALNRKEEQQQGRPDSLISSYLEMFVTELEQSQPPASGVLAAMAESPEFLAPVRRFNRKLLDRLEANSSNVAKALIVYLALEGMRSLRLFELDVLTPDERETVLRSLDAMVEATA